MYIFFCVDPLFSWLELFHICHIFRSIIGMYLLCDESINKLYLCGCAKKRERKGQNEMNAENIFLPSPYLKALTWVRACVCIFFYFCYRIEGSIGRQWKWHCRSDLMMMMTTTTARATTTTLNITVPIELFLGNYILCWWPKRYRNNKNELSMRLYEIGCFGDAIPPNE